MLKIYKLGFLSIYLFAYLFSYHEKASRRYTVQNTSYDRDRPKYVNSRVHVLGLINFSLGIFKKEQSRPHL